MKHELDLLRKVDRQHELLTTNNTATSSIGIDRAPFDLPWFNSTLDLAPHLSVTFCYAGHCEETVRLAKMQFLYYENHENTALDHTL